MSESKIFYFDGDDPEMLEAYEKARGTFRYFWRELTWEYRRIIPALSMSAVKAAFSDTKPGKASKTKPMVEQMWFSDIFFDGETITGQLLNSPNNLKSVKEGDQVSRTLDEISDWLYSDGDQAYGGFTVNLMRSRMNKKERKQHDDAWGLDFGDPNEIRLVFGDHDPDDEHPMSVNMAEALQEQLKENRKAILSPDENGWTTFHSMCLGGSLDCVKVLLKAGADPNEKTGNGFTPLQLARKMGWEQIAALLLKHGAK